MKLNSNILALTATLLVSAPVLAQAQGQTAVTQTPGQVTVGAARFTVVTPVCVRLEYAPNNGFVDAPTLFAINRSAREAKVKIQRSANGVTLDTGALRLVYKADGKPFNENNLKVTFRNGKRAGSWQPGQANTGNMGGPVATLDFTSGPINLPNGLISRDGWALVDDSGHALRINNWIAARPGGGPPSEDIPEKNKDLDWYLFASGQNYQEALRSLKTLSGPAAIPRREVLGSWNSRWAKLSSDDYRQIVREYEGHDFPLDVVVMDMEWHTQNSTGGLKWADNYGWTGYTWNRQLLPDPAGLLQEFKNKGVYVTLNDHPHNGIRDHEEIYPQFMRSLGKEPATGNNLPFDAGDKRYMEAFWAASHEPLEKQGVDFWWLDWQQDSLIKWVPGVPGLRHLTWLNEFYFEQSEKAGLRGQGYSRWGGWGDQRHPMQFSGDTTSNWSVLGFEVPFSATSGNGGCFYWAHDTGGFFGSRNAEQYTRWTQFSGLSAALRVHSAGEDRRPWLWGKQSEEAMRATYRLRSELFPYIYTSVRQAYDDMKPLVRPMYLSYPEREEAYDVPAQYLYGDNVLVAPIVTPGVGPGFVAQQSVWFPQGTWYNTFSGEKLEGNTQALVTADLSEVPVYMRGGVPIPMQPYTQRMTSTPISQLRVRCYPGETGKTGTSSLYEDDGRTAGYQKGAFAKTPLSYTRNGNSVEIKIGPTSGTYQGQLGARSYLIELPGTARATRATLKSGTSVVPLQVQYDGATQTNSLLVPAQSIGKSLTIIIACGVGNFTALKEKAMSRRIEGILGRPGTSSDALKVLASTPGITQAQEQMLLATAGIGIAKQMVGPNFRDNPRRTVFYAPKGVIAGNTIRVSQRTGASKEQTLSEGALLLSDTARAIPILDFRVGNKAYQLPNAANPLLAANNIALAAKVTTSRTEGGYDAGAAIDGVAEGYPENPGSEWSAGQKEGATYRLDWNTPQTVDRIVLFDRPNSTDDVTSGVLTFSDGSTLEVGPLTNQGTELRFAPKTISWVSFKVTGVKAGTVNAGLSEFAVFKTN